MRRRPIFPLIIVLLSLSGIASAAPKMVTLTDGSVIKGEVMKLENGVYTIKTAHMGEIKIEEEKIVTISTQATGTQQTTGAGASNSSSLKDQTQQIQSQIIGNPEILGKIGALMDDPQIKQILSDPNLMKDVMTYDENTIRSNTSVQQLLSNPRIQQLIKEIEQGTQLTP